MAGQYVNPQNTTDDIATIVETAQETVIDRFSQVTEFADDAMKTAMQFLSELKDAADDLDFDIPEIGMFFPAPISVGFNIGDPPVSPEVEIYLPEFPEAPILAAIGLVTDIQARLQYDLTNGGTGMNPAVEEQIWRREEERALIALDDAKENIASEWSKRGFPLPDGVLVAQLTQADIDYRNKRLDLSRDIAIKQYELAFQHTQFIIQQVLVMENLLVSAVSEGNKNLIQKYAADMDGVKSKVQAAVERLKGIVSLFSAEGDVYKAKAQAQAAIAEVDVKVAEATINVALNQMQLFLKQAELRIHNADAMARIRVAAAEAGGRIAAQLAAGALSGISVQAHISAAGNATKTYSGQEQLSESYTHSAT
jgi:hypothetical protein